MRGPTGVGPCGGCGRRLGAGHAEGCAWLTTRRDPDQARPGYRAGSAPPPASFGLLDPRRAMPYVGDNRPLEVVIWATVALLPWGVYGWLLAGIVAS